MAKELTIENGSVVVDDTYRCPECHATGVRQSFKYCPFCGVEL